MEPTDILPLLDAFPVISLNEMETVRLMDRTDTKFLTTLQRLPDILRQMGKHYRIQYNGNDRMSGYRTLYYDTEGLQMYHRHHAGKASRQKIRFRTYLSTGSSFCEIKNKNNKGRTHKERRPVETRLADHMTEDSCVLEFLHTHAACHPEDLLPQVETNFERLTFVNREKTERLTIDLHLRFRNYQTEKEYEEKDLVIIEMKQSGRSATFFRQLMLQMRIPPYRISKYCLGTVRTNSSVKHNRFKPKIRYIESLIKNTQHAAIC